MLVVGSTCSYVSLLLVAKQVQTLKQPHRNSDGIVVSLVGFQTRKYDRPLDE